MAKLVTRLALTSILNRIRLINQDMEVFDRYNNVEQFNYLSHLSTDLMKLYTFVSNSIVSGEFRFTSKGDILPVMNSEYDLTRTELDRLMEVCGVTKVTAKPQLSSIFKKSKTVTQLENHGLRKEQVYLNKLSVSKDPIKRLESFKLKGTLPKLKPSTNSVDLAAAILNYYPTAKSDYVLGHRVKALSALSSESFGSPKPTENANLKQFFRVICAVPRLSAAHELVSTRVSSYPVRKYAALLSNYNSGLKLKANAAAIHATLQKDDAIFSITEPSLSISSLCVGLGTMSLSDTTKSLGNFYFTTDIRHSIMKNVVSALGNYFYNGMTMEDGAAVILAANTCNMLTECSVSDRYIATIMDNYLRMISFLRELFTIVDTENHDFLNELKELSASSLILADILSRDPKLTKYR